MGWERKRGKIDEFNRLLRGARDTTFTTQVGELDVLPQRALLHHARHRHAPAARRREVAHRHHRASAATGRGSTRAPAASPRATRILQPRVSVTMASAAGSLFARLYAGHTGVDPYTTAVSDAYQDLFDEGIFTGKGLVRRGRLRPGARTTACRRTRSCRTTSSRACTRGRRSSPTSKSSTTTRRACSPTRSGSTAGCAATGRFCWWLLPIVPDAIGLAAQPAAAHRALEDLRQPAAQPDGAGDAGAAPGRLDRCCPARRSSGPRSGSRRWRFRSPTQLVALLGRAGRRAALARGARGRAAGGCARRAAGRVPRQPGVRHAARHHRDARPRRVHARASPRVGNGRGHRQPRRTARRRRVREAHDGEPAPGGRRARSASPPSIRARSPRRCRSCCSGRRRRRSRSSLSRPASVAPRGADAEDRAFSSSRRPQDLALLRHLRRAGRPRAAARQRPDGARPARGASHVADQHRDGPARHAVGARPRLHRHRRAWSRGSTRP